MTERLSGPALAGRLLHNLGSSGLLTPEIWSDPEVPLSAVGNLFREIEALDVERECATVAQRMRAASLPVASALLRWVDDCLAKDPAADLVGSEIAARLCNFTAEVASELAAALSAWMVAPSWARYGRRIVLTGGVGIRFLASTDRAPPHRRPSYLDILREGLPADCQVERSQLRQATERECYLFRYQPPSSHTNGAR
jgi:hypothetical protein